MAQQSFRQLFGDVTKVTVPMIQRDYAQGRKSEAKVREGFVRKLKRLVNGEPGSLDFIYGAMENGAFIPLDGQQRLTTLFLLHWLAAKREKVAPEQYEFLKQFSYETRANSKYFCEHLIPYTPSDTGDIAQDIRRQKWYRLEWNNDPTVDSMLRMLEYLDGCFYPDKENIKPIWESLDNIQFYCFNIENLGLTDDIYIKMNSRGKPLTDFEHFKASFDKVCGDRMARKMDLGYTDRMWRLGNVSPCTAGQREEDRDFIPDVDSYLLNFIHVVSRFITLSLYGTEPSDNPMDWIEDIYSRGAMVRILERAFDAICTDEAEGVFELFLTRDDCGPSKINVGSTDINLLDQACVDGAGIGYVELLLLYAVVLYLYNHNTCGPGHERYITEENMRSRLRVLRNLLKNSNNEFRPSRYRDIFREVGALILHGTLDSSLKALNENQKEEEIGKMAYIAECPEAETEIAAIENHPLLLGALSAIGWRKPELFGAFRSAFGNYREESALLTRAILCNGDITCKENGWRIRMGVGENGLDSLWRNVLFVNRDNFRIITVLPVFLERYAAAVAAGAGHLEVLQDMIGAYRPDGFGLKDYIIKYPSILEKARYGKFYDDEDMGWIAIYTEKKPGRNWSVVNLAIIEAYGAGDGRMRLNLGEYWDLLCIEGTDLIIDATKPDAVYLYRYISTDQKELIDSYPIPAKGTADVAAYVVKEILPQIQSR
jgi:hypothetical protein